VKLVGIMFYLVHLAENNLVKTTFAIQLTGGDEISGGILIFRPGNGLE